LKHRRIVIRIAPSTVGSSKSRISVRISPATGRPSRFHVWSDHLPNILNIATEVIFASQANILAVRHSSDVNSYVCTNRLLLRLLVRQLLALEERSIEASISEESSNSYLGDGRIVTLIA
jgi:hypothetical protein